MKPSLGLYIHIPFCSQKCRYCGFFSQVGTNEMQANYIQSLLQEIDLYKHKLQSYKINTIYIGGGTPSLLTPKQIGSLISRCRQNFTIKKRAEISIELNPESVTLTKLKACQNIGINRLSIGVQACQNTLLEYMGRQHSYKQLKTVIHWINRLGFTNFNLDLIFGIPNQTMLDWQESLERIMAFNPSHIACYSLEIEENSVFGIWQKSGILKPADEKLDRNMYHLAQKLLKQNGYRQYEISNFAQPGFACRHNLDFWHYKPYIGLGAGAYSFFNNKRYCNVKNIAEYCEQINNGKLPKKEMQDICKSGQLQEAFLVGLRLTDGISILKFQQQFGVDIGVKYEKQIGQLAADKLILLSKNRIKLSKKGIDIVDYVIREFIEFKKK